MFENPWVTSGVTASWFEPSYMAQTWKLDGLPIT